MVRFRSAASVGVAVTLTTAVVAVLLLVKFAQAPAAPNTAAASPFAGPATSPSVAVASSSRASPPSFVSCPGDWVRYTDIAMGVSFCHPSGWIEKGSYGHDFISEPIDSPYQLSASGIWLVLRAGPDPNGTCSQANIHGNVSHQATRSVSGTAATYVYDDEEFPNIVANIGYLGRCYSFMFMNGSSQGRDANASTIDRVLSTVTLFT